MVTPQRVVIMGAGGRDFHVFNCEYRDNAAAEVVAFTATQIPHIDQRTYPPILAGPRYPDGIPIRPEADLERIVADDSVDKVVFAYSDVPLAAIDAMRSRVTALGAAFEPFEPERGLLPATRPCVAVCAVRTGCGKSPLSRRVAALLKQHGARPAVIRHPMPYGNLAEQVIQRFASVDDLSKHRCTIEELEEYEPHVRAGHVVYAGADYAGILAMAEAEADVVVWDGGNNDTPFIRPDLLITVLDPLRAGDEVTYFPGTWNLDHADVIVIGKSDEATDEQLAAVEQSIRQRNPSAPVLHGRLALAVDDTQALAGKRVLVVEDGPTTTHGGMPHGAGYRAATRAGAAEIVDPRAHAAGEIANAYVEYGHIGPVLPALGYAPSQLADLKATIDATDCDVVVVATPIDLGRVIAIDRPSVRVTYDFEECGPARLAGLLAGLLGG